MSLVCFGSVRGAPGTTTAALAVASWIEQAVLVEADPDGGVLALRYALGREPGLVTLAASQTLEANGLRAHAQALPGGTPVLVAPESPEQATHLWRAAGGRLAALLAEPTDGHVIVDLGRVGLSSPANPLIGRADLLVLVSRPVAEEIIPTAERAIALGRDIANVGIVLVGERPYTATDVRMQLEVAVLGTIAFDPKGALALSGGRSTASRRRSPLMRTARVLAGDLVALASGHQPSDAGAPSTEVPA